MKSGHSDSAEIKEALHKLEDAKTKLAQAWEDRKKTLDQALKLQVIKITAGRFASLRFCLFQSICEVLCGA